MLVTLKCGLAEILPENDIIFVEFALYLTQISSNERVIP